MLMRKETKASITDIEFSDESYTVSFVKLFKKTAIRHYYFKKLSDLTTSVEGYKNQLELQGFKEVKM